MNLVSVKALSLSAGIRDYLRQPRSGRVLAVFHRSCYLDLEGRIVALVAPDLLNGPLNIVVSTPPDGTFGRMWAGSTASATPQQIRIGGHFDIELTSARPWNAALSPWRDVELQTLRANLDVVKDTMIREAPAESLAHRLADARIRRSDDRDVLEARSGEAMAQLATGIREGEPAGVAAAAGRLAGLGSGLTPSGDDVLVGTLVAIAVRPPANSAALRSAIINAARGRTTRISVEYLEAAARDEAGAAWHRLLDVLPKPRPPQLIPAARRVMAFGETSGADMLAGLLLALEALTAYVLRGKNR